MLYLDLFFLLLSFLLVSFTGYAKSKLGSLLTISILYYSRQTKIDNFTIRVLNLLRLASYISCH